MRIEDGDGGGGGDGDCSFNLGVVGCTAELTLDPLPCFQVSLPAPCAHSTLNSFYHVRTCCEMPMSMLLSVSPKRGFMMRSSQAVTFAAVVPLSVC